MNPHNPNHVKREVGLAEFEAAFCTVVAAATQFPGLRARLPEEMESLFRLEAIVKGEILRARAEEATPVVCIVPHPVEHITPLAESIERSRGNLHPVFAGILGGIGLHDVAIKSPVEVAD